MLDLLISHGYLCRGSASWLFGLTGSVQSGVGERIAAAFPARKLFF